MCNYWRDRTDTGLYEPLNTIPPDLPINDEVRNDAHIASKDVRLY